MDFARIDPGAPARHRTRRALTPSTSEAGDSCCACLGPATKWSQETVHPVFLSEERERARLRWSRVDNGKVVG